VRGGRKALVAAWVLAMALPAPGARADDASVDFDRLSIEQGLSQSIVEQMVQDPTGFMWFATEDGLNRFDGYTFTVYRNVPGDPSSLSHNELKAICTDRSGALWVGTFSGGLNRFDPATEKAARFGNDPEDPSSLAAATVRSLLQDRDGALWVGTQDGGLDRFDPATGGFVHHRHDPADPSSLSHDDVRALFEDRAGELWVGTNGGGLDRLDRPTGRFAHLRHDPGDPSSLSHDGVTAILEDHLGTLWVGTSGGGLNALDRTTGRFAHYRSDPADPTALASDHVRALLEDTTGTLWVGTDTGGLHRLDRVRGAFTRSTNDPVDPHSLSSDRVYSLYQDRSHVLWVGTYGGGLSRFDVGRKKFRRYRNDPTDPDSLSHDIVWSFAEGADGVMWIGTDGGGLNRWDRTRGHWRHFLPDPDNPASLSHRTVRDLLFDRRGALWVATNGGGLDRFDPETGRFEHFRHDPTDPSSLAHDDLRSLLEAPDGSIWVGTFGGGLDRLDPETGRFTHHRNDPHDPSSLSGDFLRHTLVDRQGVLWVGTQGGGLNRLEPGSARFERFVTDPDDPSTISNNHVFALLEARDGTLWFGTFGGGVNRFDRTTGRFERFGSRDGLASDSVYAMLEDDRGRLWISTTRGLSRFDPADGSCRNYDVRDGLQSNEFNGGAAYRSPDGEMFFGGIHGFNAFFPEEIGLNPEPPAVVVTGLRLFNRPVKVGEPVNGRVVLRRAMAFTDAIVLSHRDAVFSLELAALHYSAPEKNLYAYQMEGLSNTWIPVDADLRLATFSGLPAGHYILHLRGANSDGVWSPRTAAVRVTVTPPFWGTWWFRLGALAMAGALAFLVARDRMSRVRMRTELAAAHAAQMAIMPQGAPTVEGFDLAAVCIPAHEVGGDFFDYFWVEGHPRRLCMAVGDVAGKAMPAAMTAVMSDGMVISQARQGGSVGEVMTSVNRTLNLKVSRRMFTACCLLALDPRSGELCFANAGLCEPLYRSGGSTEFLASPGPRFPLGTFRDIVYEHRVQRLRPGDVVVVFTDGVPEARNPSGELYGYETLRRLLAGLDPSLLSAAAIRDTVVADVRRFSGSSRQCDDIAVLVMVATGRQDDPQ